MRWKNERTQGVAAAGLSVLFAGTAGADSLYSNGSADPARPALGATATTLSGVSAPPGGWWSEAPSVGAGANSVGGYSTHGPGDEGEFRFADDFTVPPGGWTLRTLSVYAYSPGVLGPLSPFSGITLRIWSGPPGDPESLVVFGDDSTNRLINSAPSGVFRVFSSTVGPLPALPDTTRAIWETSADLGGVFLGEGTYWLDWQYQVRDLDTPAFSPAVTIPGSRGTGNARQLRASAGVTSGGWIGVIDPGKPAQIDDVPQDLPFVITGESGPPCDPDLNCDGSIDQGDIACLVLAVAGETACLCAGDGDFNADGSADQGDLAALIGVVAGQPCP